MFNARTSSTGRIEPYGVPYTRRPKVFRLIQCCRLACARCWTGRRRTAGSGRIPSYSTHRRVLHSVRSSTACRSRPAVRTPSSAASNSDASSVSKWASDRSRFRRAEPGFRASTRQSGGLAPRRRTATPDPPRPLPASARAAIAGADSGRGDPYIAQVITSPNQLLPSHSPKYSISSSSSTDPGSA